MHGVVLLCVRVNPEYSEYSDGGQVVNPTAAE